jgi:hypothetical protein
MLDVEYRTRMTSIIHQQLWGYRIKKKLHLGVRDQNVEYNFSTAFIWHLFKKFIFLKLRRIVTDS